MKTKVFNPLDYLQDDQEVSDYLHDAFMDDDPQVFVVALGYVIKQRGVASVAELTGLNRESLYKSIGGDTKPTWDTMQRLIKGLKLDVRFEAMA